MAPIPVSLRASATRAQATGRKCRPQAASAGHRPQVQATGRECRLQSESPIGSPRIRPPGRCSPSPRRRPSRRGIVSIAQARKLPSAHGDLGQGLELPRTNRRVPAGLARRGCQRAPGPVPGGASRSKLGSVRGLCRLDTATARRLAPARLLRAGASPGVASTIGESPGGRPARRPRRGSRRSSDRVRHQRRSRREHLRGASHPRQCRAVRCSLPGRPEAGLRRVGRVDVPGRRKTAFFAHHAATGETADGRRYPAPIEQKDEERPHDAECRTAGRRHAYADRRGIRGPVPSCV